MILSDGRMTLRYSYLSTVLHQDQGGDIERQCAMKCYTVMNRILPPVGFIIKTLTLPCLTWKVDSHTSCNFSLNPMLVYQHLCSKLKRKDSLFFFFFFFFFGFGFYSPFKDISLISSQSFIEGGRKLENPGKNHLTICQQNLAFPHVTQARLELQQWEI